MSLRLAGSADRGHLERWLFRQDKLYAKFSLGALPDWLEHGVCLVSEGRAGATGFVLATRISARFATIIGLAVADGEPLSDTVSPLLARLLDILGQQGVEAATCVTSMDWLVGLLCGLGFGQTGRLASYVKSDWETPTAGDESIRVRACQPADLPQVAAADHAAFEPSWRQDEEMMALSLKRSDWFIAAERGARIVGYACGTGRGSHGHISRLAVAPVEQGHGVGSRLLYESLILLKRARVDHVTLNTQEDNLRSRRLYERFGFRVAHLDLQVMQRPVERPGRDWERANGVSFLS